MRLFVWGVILNALLCSPGWAQSTRRREAPKRTQSAWDAMQEVEKKVNLFEMVAKSFIAAIDAGDYRGAFRMMAERLDISNTADAAAIKGAREKAFEDFTATVKGAPAFQRRARIDYRDVALTDDAMKRAEVHARITVKNGDTFDVMWSISEVPDGWRINYFLTGRRFPP